MKRVLESFWANAFRLLKETKGKDIEMNVSTKLIGAVSAVAMSALAASSAMAATTFQGTFSVVAYTVGPALQITSSPTNGNLGPFDLNVGEDTGYFKLFRIGTNENIDAGFDDALQPISVSFNFTEPGSIGSVSGSTNRHIGRRNEFGTVTWADPVSFTFGQSDSGVFQVFLTDAKFTKRDDSWVKAKIKYVTAPTAVPLPAGGLLLVGGLAGLGALRRRRKAA